MASLRIEFSRNTSLSSTFSAHEQYFAKHSEAVEKEIAKENSTVQELQQSNEVMKIVTTSAESRKYNEHKTTKKVCGNIHRDEYRDFWMELTENDSFVWRIIKEGYELQFETEPEVYQERTSQHWKTRNS